MGLGRDFPLQVIRTAVHGRVRGILPVVPHLEEVFRAPVIERIYSLGVFIVRLLVELELSVWPDRLLILIVIS